MQYSVFARDIYTPRDLSSRESALIGTKFVVISAIKGAKDYIFYDITKVFVLSRHCYAASNKRASYTKNAILLTRIDHIYYIKKQKTVY